MTLVTAGRVGRPHGLDGSFYVDDPKEPLEAGALVLLAGAERAIERRAGTTERPLLRLAGIDDPRPLRGESLLLESELEEDEWLAADLVGCEVEGLGAVKRVLDAPSCHLLETGDGTLVPFISDAIVAVDVTARRIRADLGYLGLE